MPPPIVLLSIPHVVFRRMQWWHSEVGRDIIDIAFVKGDSRSGICDDGLHVGRRVFDGIFYLEVVGAGAYGKVGSIGRLVGSSIEGKVGEVNFDEVVGRGVPRPIFSPS